MLQKQKGFTLIELMIVVAIIGILAAVAIPGFMSYIKNSKTSEAKTNLDAIKKGALTYYEAEHYLNGGMNAVSKQYPQSESTPLIIGATPTANTIGVKQSPISFQGDAGFGKKPWSDLNFVLTAPFYYAYAYASNGITEVAAVPATGSTAAVPAHTDYAQSHFHATACASLNTEKDSVFQVSGYSDGSTSPVIEADKSTCGTATAPTTDPTA